METLYAVSKLQGIRENYNLCWRIPSRAEMHEIPVNVIATLLIEWISNAKSFIESQELRVGGFVIPASMLQVLGYAQMKKFMDIFQKQDVEMPEFWIELDDKVFSPILYNLLGEFERLGFNVDGYVVKSFGYVDFHPPVIGDHTCIAYAKVGHESSVSKTTKALQQLTDYYGLPENKILLWISTSGVLYVKAGNYEDDKYRALEIATLGKHTIRSLTLPVWSLSASTMSERKYAEVVELDDHLRVDGFGLESTVYYFSLDNDKIVRRKIEIAQEKYRGVLLGEPEKDVKYAPLSFPQEKSQINSLLSIISGAVGAAAAAVEEEEEEEPQFYLELD